MSARVDVAELLARARARGAAGDLEAAEGALRQVLAAEPGRLRSLTAFPWLPSSVSTS